MVTFKIVLVGDATVGKTSIANRHIYHRFSNLVCSTIGASFMAYSPTIDDEEVKVNIWDTAGQERFRSFTSLYYRDADLAIVVFDLSQPDFDNVIHWLNQINQSNPRIKTVLVGNKSDLVDSFESEELLQIIDDFHIDYIATSALTNYNIKELFENVNSKLDVESKKNELKREGIIKLEDDSWGSYFHSIFSYCTII